jgi:hypothetical protein
MKMTFYVKKAITIDGLDNLTKEQQEELAILVGANLVVDVSEDIALETLINNGRISESNEIDNYYSVDND